MQLIDLSATGASITQRVFNALGHRDEVATGRGYICLQGDSLSDIWLKFVKEVTALLRLCVGVAELVLQGREVYRERCYTLTLYLPYFLVASTNVEATID